MWVTLLTWVVRVGKEVAPALGIMAVAFAAGHFYAGQLKQEAMAELVQENSRLAAAIAVCQGAQEALTAAQRDLSEQRQQLVAQAEAEKSAVTAKLNQLYQALSKMPRTGDECRDAKAVAREYFSTKRQEVSP